MNKSTKIYDFGKYKLHQEATNEMVFNFAFYQLLFARGSYKAKLFVWIITVLLTLYS